MIGTKTARAAAKLWYVKMLHDQQSVPVPRDSPIVASGASDPDRVLLVGNGAAHGWGTVTHDLALTGQLARALTSRTDRPTDVRYVGDELMPLAAVRSWLRGVPLGGYDLVLVVLSMNDALRLTPVEEYGDEMTRLLETLTEGTKPSARIVVSSIQPVGSLAAYNGIAARIGQRSADALNAATRGLVGRFDGVSFLELDAPEPEPGRPHGSPQLYAEWSARFSAPCAEALDVARALDPERTHVAEREHEWHTEAGRHLIEGAPLGGHDSLNRFVEAAKRHFGVDAAWVSVIDGDRQFYAANTAPTGRSAPLELTHCRVTIAGDEPVVVENSLRDPRFKDSPLIDLSQQRFYAGVPLKDDQGRNIGTFCVSSVVPRSSRSVSETDLQSWAMRAQEEMQRLAADSTSPAEALPQ